MSTETFWRLGRAYIKGTVRFSRPRQGAPPTVRSTSVHVSLLKSDDACPTYSKGRNVHPLNIFRLKAIRISNPCSTNNLTGHRVLMHALVNSKSIFKNAIICEMFNERHIVAPAVIGQSVLPLPSLCVPAAPAPSRTGRGQAGSASLPPCQLQARHHC